MIILKFLIIDKFKMNPTVNKLCVKSLSHTLSVPLTCRSRSFKKEVTLNTVAAD